MSGNPSGCKELWRRLALSVAALVALAAHPSSARAGGPDDQKVTLSIANTSPVPLSCTIQFAHFVSTDAGAVAPGDDLSIKMFRQNEDGALWIPRRDGRRMMIETIDCGAEADWAATRGQVSLLPARAGRSASYSSRCRLSQKVTCDVPEPTP